MNNLEKMPVMCAGELPLKGRLLVARLPKAVLKLTVFRASFYVIVVKTDITKKFFIATLMCFVQSEGMF